MPLTDTTLLFMATLATLATAVSLLPDGRVDDYLKLLAPWIAAVIWGMTSLSAFNVVLGNFGTSQPMLAMAWLAGGAAVFSAIIGVVELFTVLGNEANRADLDLTGGRS